MTIFPIETGNFKLDGGAMFGVVPKAIWQRTNPADSNNMIDIAARSLLIEDGDRLILIDNGMGTKQSEKFYSYYYRWGNYNLESSLKKYGFHKDNITDVFMTHLHFDHCGGSVEWNKDRTSLRPAFKNARYWTNKEHWSWAINPNEREKASFLKENLFPMQESGQLCFVDRNENSFVSSPDLGFDILFVDGHTEKQMIPHIKYKGKTLVFMADLLPTVGHIPLPYVMGYDVRPLKTLTEKSSFLNKAAADEFVLFLEHDAHNELCTLKETEKGIRLNNTYSFNEIFNA
ncbi:MBL fold metallo-hydrolase [Eudoraea chungangensis]|uniref:MBL fold metallo-hydrolase n=1 Tax=Eudoraea chungangensis TaxID=1481905 RepID=UPI0023ED18D0|nr:MBL fold metallo-hydrolase [Eudoraea chungangensis]